MRLVDRGSCWERTTRRGLLMPALLDLRRSAAAFVAVAMSAALIVFVFIVSDSVRTRITESARASVGDADVVVLADHKDDAARGRISERACSRSPRLTGSHRCVPMSRDGSWPGAGARLRRAISWSWTYRRSRAAPAWWRAACRRRITRSPSSPRRPGAAAEREGRQHPHTEGLRGRLLHDREHCRRGPARG